MKWSRDHVLTWGYMTDLRFRLTVDLDRLNIIISGSVVMTIDAKYVFQEGHLAAIYKVRSG
jgi:hypothetical protein